MKSTLKKHLVLALIALVILQMFIPLSWAFVIVWFGIGAVSIERLLPGITRGSLLKEIDPLGIALIAFGGMLGAITLLITEDSLKTDKEFSKELQKGQSGTI